MGGRFVENEADRGGVFLDQGEVVVENGIFEGNRAYDGAVGFTYRGSALYVNGGTFSQNVAGNGGVFFVDGECEVVVANGTFVGNEAYDGAVGFTSEDSALYVNGGIFSRNIAVNSGGVFFVPQYTTFAVSFGADEEKSFEERGSCGNCWDSAVSTPGVFDERTQLTLKEVCWLEPLVEHVLGGFDKLIQRTSRTPSVPVPL